MVVLLLYTAITLYRYAVSRIPYSIFLIPLEHLPKVKKHPQPFDTPSHIKADYKAG